MVKLIFVEWSWQCENCNGKMLLPGIIASLSMLKKRGWKYCPYCGEEFDYKGTKVDERNQKILKEKDWGDIVW